MATCRNVFRTETTARRQGAQTMDTARASVPTALEAVDDIRPDVIAKLERQLFSKPDDKLILTELASIFSKLGLLEEAMSYYARLHALDPADSDNTAALTRVTLALSLRYYECSEPQLAQALAVKAAALTPSLHGDRPFLLHKACCAAALGDAHSALEAVAEVDAATPTRNPLSWAVEAHFRAGGDDRIAAYRCAFRAAAELGREHELVAPVVRPALAWAEEKSLELTALLLRRRLPEAVQLAGAVLAVQPSPDVFAKRAQARAALREFYGAAEDLRLAILLGAQAGFAGGPLSEAQEEKLRTGYFARELLSAHEREVLAMAALPAGAEFEHLARALALCLHQIAQTQLQTARVDEALFYALEACQLSRAPEFFVTLGDIYTRRSCENLAFDAYTQAIEIDEQVEGARHRAALISYRRAIAAFNAGQLAKCGEFVEEAVALCPSVGAFYQLKLQLCTRRRDVHGMAASARDVLRFFPADDTARMVLQNMRSARE
eukprot:gnl/Chilomastix_cuspidata/3602.p1 GENE.gnl/Chilomastix_cuspidata/3602~~gnl/Chilomastix_cuspidata/3602.p1  ORF type:complete len:494 (-),score=231.46 gnl/Chilomastix_cuspidata/3602:59-1540(-)